MKRKITFILVLALIVTAIGASAVFAKDSVSNDEKSVIKSMFENMRDWSKQAEDSGEITKEEAKEWNEHFNTMEKYHKENGIEGHCGGTNSVEGNNQNYMSGYGSGMMNSFSNGSL